MVNNPVSAESTRGPAYCGNEQQNNKGTGVLGDWCFWANGVEGGTKEVSCVACAAGQSALKNRGCLDGSTPLGRSLSQDPSPVRPSALL